MDIPIIKPKAVLHVCKLEKLWSISTFPLFKTHYNRHNINYKLMSNIITENEELIMWCYNDIS